TRDLGDPCTGRVRDSGPPVHGEGHCGGGDPRALGDVRDGDAAPAPAPLRTGLLAGGHHPPLRSARSRAPPSTRPLYSPVMGMMTRLSRRSLHGILTPSARHAAAPAVPQPPR